MGDDFPRQRREAEDVLRRVLAAPMSDDTDGMQAMNLEAARARALAQFDCWAPRWLQAAFAEVDRLQRWADLRAGILDRVANRHRPIQAPDGRWMCADDGQLYPCRTRKDLNPQ